MPRPIDALWESITCTGPSPATAAAATWADCMVPERCDDRLMQTIPVAPRLIRSRNFASKAPGEGAAVSGKVGRLLDPAPELVDGEVDLVDELLVAEADREGHDLDPHHVDERRRQVATAVGDDPNTHEFPARRACSKRWRTDLWLHALAPPAREQGGEHAQLVDPQQ